MNVAHTLNPVEFPAVTGTKTHADGNERLKRHLQRTKPGKMADSMSGPGNILVRK
jgi:hypothetical protein